MLQVAIADWPETLTWAMLSVLDHHKLGKTEELYRLDFTLYHQEHRIKRTFILQKTGTSHSRVRHIC
jgi:hypothetical protein